MIYIPTGEEMRMADLYTIQEIGIPSMVLMERAALQVVNSMEKEQLNLRKILVVCGSGNNGGDGYAIARLLYLKGYDVSILFVGNDKKRSMENKLQAQIVSHYPIPIISKLENLEYSVVVDALFGTGLKRSVSGIYYNTLMQLNSMNATKVAVDIPSGINDATGKIMGIAFKADFTISLGFLKRGLLLESGNVYSGQLITVDIGISSDVLQKEMNVTFGYEEKDLYLRFPKRKKNSHKGSYGKVLMVVGSKGMSGAAYLSAKAAYATGAGLVKIYTHEENRIILQQLLPEAILTTYESFHLEEFEKLIQWADVIGIGCGLGTSDVSEKLVHHTLTRATIPCVVDADGINILSRHMDWLDQAGNNIILTPHMKEMSRLISCDVQQLAEQRMDKLQEFVAKYSVVCVLKDARTLVSKSGEKVYLNLSGNSAMAKAASGDVLMGIITGIVAQHCDMYEAACLGVYLHGLAGDYARDQKGSYSVLASDLIEEIGKILKKM